ncbi:MAG: hypothetical protein Q8M94_00615, partial [Ignavibacteria bacterium]|nr:hypothetical protein [Ignavibacteria bacterium]
MKILNISTLFFLLWCTLFLLSCKSTDTKESLLIKKNNVLNAALSDKKWETIYKLKDEASQNKIGPSNWSKNWDQKSFIEEYSSHYFYGEISIKNLSYKILKDSAETINLIKIKTIPTKQVYEDTTYHY